MLAVPPVLLDTLRLRSGSKVGIAVERGRLIVEPRARPHYSLDELLRQSKTKAPSRKQDREWLIGKRVGRELI
jgi:antitoxin ChpS